MVRRPGCAASDGQAGAGAPGEEVHQRAGHEDAGEQGGDDANHQRDREALDGPGAVGVENDTCDEGGDVGVDSIFG